MEEFIIKKGINMNFQKRTPDLEKVFNQRWKANNYSQNGIQETIKNDQQRKNNIIGINSPPKNMRKPVRTTQEETLTRLEQSMNALPKRNNNNFR